MYRVSPLFFGCLFIKQYSIFTTLDIISIVICVFNRWYFFTISIFTQSLDIRVKIKNDLNILFSYHLFCKYTFIKILPREFPFLYQNRVYLFAHDPTDKLISHPSMYHCDFYHTCGPYIHIQI